MQGGLIGRTARRLSHILMAPVQVVIRKAKRTISPDSFASKVKIGRASCRERV